MHKKFTTILYTPLTKRTNLQINRLYLIKGGINMLYEMRTERSEKMDSDNMKVLNGIRLAPYIQLSTELIKKHRKAGGNMFRHQMETQIKDQRLRNLQFEDSHLQSMDLDR